MMAYVEANMGKRTKLEWQYSYQRWIKGGSGWDRLQEGGTGIMRVLCWYHHVHKPGSAEWRPKIILAALLKAAVAEGAPS
jgi:hypothetical protein